MTKKVLVIPDVHGRLFWKEPVTKYMDEVDRVVFLGDYLDPYSGETRLADDIYENLMEIMELKRNNREKVVLLKGNHDQHYASKLFDQLAGGSRQDLEKWNTYHMTFNENRDLFKIAHWEEVNGKTYVFTHAGLTLYWLKKVNDRVWKLPDNQVSIADPDIIERINQLDDDGIGQEMLGIVGRRRSWFGEKTGSVLWADIQEHDIDEAPNAYGLNKVFQVFGHTRLNEGYDKIEFDHLAMIDSRQAFVVEGKEPHAIVHSPR